MRFKLETIFLGLSLFLSGMAYSQDHPSHGVPAKPTVSPGAAPAPKLKEAPSRKEEPRVAVDVPSQQQAKIGVKIASVEKKNLEHSVRTVGVVTADQTREAHIHTKINGWIEQIHADYIGKPVKKGQPLFELYSPDLVSTQEEYLAARGRGAGPSDIASAAWERLKLWGVPESELQRLKKTGKAKRTIIFTAPVDGFVINKTAIRGMYITPEMELYHIADLSEVWIIVTLYEYDIAGVSVGDLASVELPYEPGKSFAAKMSYVYPEIDIETRTAKARIEVPNKDQRLKPGMYVNIEMKKNFGESLVIPEDAVIDTGVRRLVFVKTSETQFEPREIKIGPRVGNSFAVFSGLKEGEKIVVSAHFLIDAESKLQAALQKGESAMKGHGEHGAGGKK